MPHSSSTADNTSRSIGDPHLIANTYSLTDAQLADSLEFIEEIGFGNWGSVWSCRSKIGSSRRKLAVKLVHRTAERTTAARVRSIWNEMKVVRTLKDSPHPAIISFHSFIITPSYALITMEYLPRLIPVEVRESKAKVWFESLLSGVAHLHNHGIVHNDIKPANILLSRSEQPVLVDFGFAERYELLDGAESFVEVVSSPLRKNGSPSCRRGNPAISNPASSSSTSLLSPSTKPVPFESSLAYGTPEYLSPERARGYKHDTRKSDVWSLGVTFFEVITGRTPFELDDENGKGEEFTTKEDLERYWSRTNNGIWVGKWKMSAGLENVLRNMLRPNALKRISADRALTDPYFSSVVLDAEITTMHITANGKIQPSNTTLLSTILGDSHTTSNAAVVTDDSTSESPAAAGTARSKLSVLHNFMTGKPKLSSSVSRSSITRKSSAAIQNKENCKSHGHIETSTPHTASPSSILPASTDDAYSPQNSPIEAEADSELGPATTNTHSRLRSLFGSHKRTKSAGMAGMGTPLTPKAVAHPAAPRVPPPTPATPLGIHKRFKGPAVPIDSTTVNVPLAAAAALQREVIARHPENTKVEPPMPSTSNITTITSPNTQAKLGGGGAPRPVGVLAPKPNLRTSPVKRAIVPKGGIRSPLRPVLGKENGHVKVKVKAIESRNAGAAPAITGAAAINMGAVSSAIPAPVGTARGGLRMRDRNAPRSPVKAGEEIETQAQLQPEKTLLKKSSWIKKHPSGALKKKENMPTKDFEQPSTEDRALANRGIRALHAITRSVDLSRPNAISPMAQIRHSVRKSIDKTAGRFSKMSSTANSLSKRASNTLQQSTLELQDSWDVLEKDVTIKATILHLPSVVDTSLEEKPLKVVSPTDEQTTLNEAAEADRLTRWIESVQKIVAETHESFDREVNLSRHSSSSKPLFPLKKPSAELPTSLPPPKRRGSGSSRRTQSRNQSTLTLDGTFRSATPGTRLPAVLDDDDRRISMQGGGRPKSSIGSINSSRPPTEMPTIPSIAIEDLDQSISMQNLDRSVAVDALPDDYFSPTEESIRDHTPWYELEPSRSYNNINSTTLDLSRLAREVGVNQHPWAVPRSSTPSSLKTSTTALGRRHISPPSPPRPAVESQSPRSPTEQLEYDRLLLASENVVRVGRGYESSRSHRWRTLDSRARTSSAMMNIPASNSSTPHLTPVENIAPSCDSTRAATAGRKHDRRRSGILATFMGRETIPEPRQTDLTKGISSTTYFASAGEFGAVGVPSPLPIPTTPITPPTCGPFAQDELDSGQPRSNTLTHRMKKAFMRVVSNQALNRPIPVA